MMKKRSTWPLLKDKARVSVSVSVSCLTTLVQCYTESLSIIWQEKAFRSERIKSNVLILTQDHPYRESQEIDLLELINDFNKVITYKINTQKSIFNCISIYKL